MRSELFIDGNWREGRGGAFASTDPAHGGVVWQGSAASAEDVVDAVAAAKRAFPAWSRTPLKTRAEVCERFAEIVRGRADDLARAISREMGKPLWDSRSEAAAVSAKVAVSLRAQAERAGERRESAPFGHISLRHRPLGVMAVFGPFNFPAHLPNGHIVPALLAGNVVVFKPSELTPTAGAILAEAWREAGLPPGVLNLVQGGREVGAALLDAEINGVLFTGSATTGLFIHRKFAGRPDVALALEMGGNNPLVVWPPVDPEAAANLIVHSAFVTSGQRCSCARRLILPEGPDGDAVLAALTRMTERIAMGPFDAATEPFIGPLVREEAAAKAEAFAKDLLALGGRALTPILRDGAFLKPALIETSGIPAPDEEAFAPLLQVIRVGSLDRAFAAANATRYGLSGGVISDDPEVWREAEIEMRAGVLARNRPTTGASSALPFGGPGLSGNLRPSAYYAADYAAYPVAAQEAEKALAIAAPGLPGSS